MGRFLSGKQKNTNTIMLVFFVYDTYDAYTRTVTAAHRPRDLVSIPNTMIPILQVLLYSGIPYLVPCTSVYTSKYMKQDIKHVQKRT